MSEPSYPTVGNVKIKHNKQTQKLFYGLLRGVIEEQLSDGSVG